MIPIAILVGGAIMAGGAAIASCWEADNDADEEELERMRERKNRFLRMRRSRLEKNRRKKVIALELAAREKELKLVRRAEKLAKRQLDCGSLELAHFKEELAVANRHSAKLPEACVEALLKDLAGKQKNFKSLHSRCLRHISGVQERITALNASRFYFRCASCRSRFAVQYRDLAEFLRSRKGMRKCCDGCYPRLKERADRRNVRKRN